MKVSVIIPAFNEERTVARAIDSVLSQDFDAEFEVVVVNDGSTDGTGKVLESYGRRIKVVNQENRGHVGARNAGVRASRGEYIAILDADDEWLRGKLTKSVAALDQSPDHVLVYTPVLLRATDGTLLGKQQVGPARCYTPSMSDLLSNLWWNILPSTVVMRRTIFDLCGGFSEQFGRSYGGADAYFFLLAREHGSFVRLPEPLTIYTVRSPADTFRRRGVIREGPDGTSVNRLKVDNYVSSSAVHARLVLQHFGTRGRKLARIIGRTRSQTLEGVGVTMMHQGDRTMARYCYLQCRRNHAFRPKVFVRLLWTYLPVRLATRLRRFLPSRLARAVAGPPRGYFSLPPAGSRLDPTTS